MHICIIQNHDKREIRLFTKKEERSLNDMAKLVGAMQLIYYLVPGTLEIWLETSEKTDIRYLRRRMHCLGIHDSLPFSSNSLTN